MNYKNWRDYPELLEKSFHCKVVQVVTGWEQDNEIEDIQHGVGHRTVGELIEEYNLDELGIEFRTTIKGGEVRVSLYGQTGREKNYDYNEAFNHYLIKFNTLGDVLTISEIFETIGIGEMNVK
jgi:hypothetical protein